MKRSVKCKGKFNKYVNHDEIVVLNMAMHDIRLKTCPIGHLTMTSITGTSYTKGAVDIQVRHDKHSNACAPAVSVSVQYLVAWLCNILLFM